MVEVQVDDGCYFPDGERCVDFVIVLKGETLDPLVTYIRNLEKVGVEFEIVRGKIVRKHFLLIHLPYEALKHFAEVYNIGVEERKVGFQPEEPLITYSYTTPISYIPTKAKGTFTNTERISIVNMLLENASYGTEPYQKGLSQLIRGNLVEDAYPLHDGPIDNDFLEYTNDRQLLFHYWSNLSVWYKEMPLDMIKKYFGCEIAFYFAWLEFFNYMLIPVAVIGTFVTFINMIHLVNFRVNPVDEVCHADNMLVCPTCAFEKHCKFEKLSSFCTFFKLSYVFDNYLTVGFAMFMTFWAILFIKWWKRKENSLKFRWEVEYQNPILERRQEFKASTKSKSTIAIDQLEPSVPKYITALRILVSVTLSLFMITLALAGLFGVAVYELTIAQIMDVGQTFLKRERRRTLAVISGSLIQMVFIQLFSLVYRKLCPLLTTFESSITQLEFDNWFLYKRYLFSFTNNYAIFFYIAFVKGRFFIMPNRFEEFAIFQKDTCQPLTCMLGLCMMVLVFLLLKRLADNVMRFLIPSCKGTFLKLDTVMYDPAIPQYEKEYKLSTDRFLLVNRFCDMVTEYGLLTFFVAALPLAPMCILLNNLLDVRLHAHQLVTRYRRPVPKKTGGIGAWNGIIFGLTYLSTVVNAFVIAFTSDFITRELYKHNIDSQLKGYVNSTLSIFSAEDSSEIRNMRSYPDICYYRSKRYPPGHRKRYQLTNEYWIEILWRLFFVFMFEHIIMLCHGIISHVISDLPGTIRIQKKIDKQLVKEAKLKMATKNSKGTSKHDVLRPSTSRKKLA